MTLTISPSPSAPGRSTGPKTVVPSRTGQAAMPPVVRVSSQTGSPGPLADTMPEARQHDSASEEPRLLGRYLDPENRLRQVVALPGARGSVLVVDRDATTLGDRRLVAHLAPDEPPENAALVCEHYLRDSAGHWCRGVTPEDLWAVPFAAAEEQEAEDSAAEAMPSATTLTDKRGCTYRLEMCLAEKPIPELRWCRRPPAGEGGSVQPVCVREAIACLESYEPVRTLTRRALAVHRDDQEVSTAMLRSEHARMEASEIVLNRGLRRAVLATAATQELSMSEIAMRCGKARHDSHGKQSGETSWLARRLGIAPESGKGMPTPWIHTDVLALIARHGLGISPREVELG
jgi:hypothetical protein